MNSDNVINFSDKLKEKQSAKAEIPKDEIIGHATEIAEDLMNDVLTIMVNDYDFKEDFYVDTPELLFAFEAIKSFVFAIYDIQHPLQDFAREVIHIEYIGDEPIIYNDELPSNDT